MRVLVVEDNKDTLATLAAVLRHEQHDVARALRKQDPARTLYIAAVTGYGTPEDKKRATEAGIDAHLAKPAHPFAIIQLLDDFESRT